MTKSMAADQMSDVILDLYGAGYSQQAIKAKLRLPVAEISRILRGAGLPTRGYHKMEPQLVRVLNVLLANHVFYRDIDKFCDISFDAARDYVARHGRSTCGFPRTYAEVPDQDLQFPELDEFVRRYAVGESFAALIEDLGLDDGKIYPLFYFLWQNKLGEAHAEALRARIGSQLAEGHPAPAVARQEHISPSITRRLAKEFASGPHPLA